MSVVIGLSAAVVMSGVCVVGAYTADKLTRKK
jgi:hypothetical protein